MQVGTSFADSALVDAGQLTSVWLKQPADWMTGAIEGKTFAGDDDREALVRAVIACLEPIDETEKPYSSCTDGRHRETLIDGSIVPVREQLVGTDTMAALVAAEALGERFYDKDTLRAPVAQRIAKVVEFLTEHGYKPTAHVSCGAAGAFLTVLNRSTQFIDNPNYVERLKQLLPDGAYDPVLHRLIVGGYQSRIDSKLYEEYCDGLVCQIAESTVGKHAVECYDDDGRGVHGHREQAIVYLSQNISGVALNPNKLIEAYGVQVFMVNSSRAEAIARLFSRDGSDDIDYKTARIAIEDFAAAGHGTLAFGMETVIIGA